MEKKKSGLDVEASTYVSRYERLEDDLVFFVREHSYPTKYDDIDVFGDFNFFAYGYAQPNQIFVKQQDRLIPIEGQAALFAPAWSLVHWVIEPCKIQWQAFSFQKCDVPITKPLLFQLETYPQIKTREDVNAFLRNHEKAIDLSVNPEPSALSLQIKSAIDSNLGEEFTLLRVAEQLNLDPYELTREFKKNFGMNPVSYRTKQRVLDSVFRLLTSKDLKSEVSRIAFDVGFADLSRFNKQFKKLIDLPPSKFLYRK